ncbi:MULTISPECIES: LuxR C-terminal-related transcriptional regulator [Microbacterium]|uniref:GAF domain-containing protein n=1 Tax=Microbacterium algeriense TaxID=2615184 RepID=A0ABQ6VB04_9MICO|nr:MULTISPECIES: LuxR C-terminal-related transcriptional regulator [Microbacterium]AZH79405.1 helix-turn-helix transcriptional regulator [Microbacterium sp. Y-01]KAB1867393.1 GAF domain-containing protein [Microbacterium algeriense]MDX2399590.1 LuxR C-terminal-related transcriptional regulator [Microbacterium algeriense]
MSATVTLESEAELVANAVRELARRTRFPVAFGGLIEEGVVSVTSIVGARTRSLDGLRVRPERGLGGRAMIELRPRMTSDYGSSQQITHDYDVFVLGEGLRTLLALPIVVQGRSRGVLYAGAWNEEQIGGITTAPAMQVAQSVADELRIRDEVQRRLQAAPASDAVAPPQREELRESFAELRSIAASVDDADIRARIAQVERRLLTLAGDAVPATTGAIPTVHLSPRETDVLACAALGSTNAEIASQLGLREGTVKAYLGTAMSKLDASTRHAAVTRARRAGLLP